MSEEHKNQEVEEMEEREEQKGEASCETCDEYLAGWKRALADYDNIQKDLARERTEIRTRVKQDVAHQLIAVLDNFDQAAKFQPERVPSDVQTWLVGLMYVRTQLEGVMTQMGLEGYGSVGEVFNAQLHDAGGERSEEGKADQEILEVVSRGWKLEDRVVRPAKVIINNLTSTT